MNIGRLSNQPFLLGGTMRTDQEIREKLAELTYLQSMFGCEDVKKIILTLHWILKELENANRQTVIKAD